MIVFPYPPFTPARITDPERRAARIGSPMGAVHVRGRCACGSDVPVDRMDAHPEARSTPHPGTGRTISGRRRDRRRLRRQRLAASAISARMDASSRASAASSHLRSGRFRPRQPFEQSVPARLRTASSSTAALERCTRSADLTSLISRRRTSRSATSDSAWRTPRSLDVRDSGLASSSATIAAYRSAAEELCAVSDQFVDTPHRSETSCDDTRR